VGSPVIGDINRDGRYEILLGLQVQEPDVSSRLYAFDDKGGIVAGWPVSLPGSRGFAALALGDINGDGYPELVGETFASYRGLFAIRRDGGVLFQGLPTGISSDVAIADLTGDGIADIFVQGEAAYSIVKADGTTVTSPLEGSPEGSNVTNMPILVDFDRNGVLDLVSIASGKRAMAFAWSLGTKANASKEEWTQYAADARHSNRYEAKRALPAPTGLSAANQRGGIALSWNPVAGASQYRIYRGVGTSWPAAYAATASHAYIDAAVSAGKSYRYFIKAMNAYGEGAASASVVILRR
jgi:hypothetical protein